MDGVGTVAKFFKPSGISVHSTGNVWVADQYNHMIRNIAAPCAVALFILAYAATEKALELI